MEKISMKVCKEKARTPEEELEYLDELLYNTGNFFSWDVHPNKVRTAHITRMKLHRKMRKVIDSEEYKFYTGQT